MTKAVIVALALALSGATLLLAACSSQNLVGSTAATLVQRYCDTPEIGRAVLREAIATSTAPNRIRVECAADAL